MALKDWKRMKLSNKDESDDIVYNSTKGIRLSISPDYREDVFRVEIRNKNDEQWTELLEKGDDMGGFNSKSQALAFAKKYMRSH